MDEDIKNDGQREQKHKKTFNHLLLSIFLIVFTIIAEIAIVYFLTTTQAREISRLGNDLAESKKELKETDKQLNDYKIKDAEYELNEKQSAFLKDQISKLESDMEDKESELEKAKSELQNINKEYEDKYSAKKTEYDEKIQKLENDKNSKEEEYEKKLDEMSLKYKSEIANMESELKTKKDELQKATKKIQEIDINKIKEDLETAKKELEKINASIDKKSIEEKQITEKIETIKEKFQNLDKDKNLIFIANYAYEKALKSTTVQEKIEYLTTAINSFVQCANYTIERFFWSYILRADAYLSLKLYEKASIDYSYAYFFKSFFNDNFDKALEYLKTQAFSDDEEALKIITKIFGDDDRIIIFLDEINEEKLYKLAKNGTSEDWQTYLDKYPNGNYKTEILKLKSEVDENELYLKAKDGTSKDCQEYINKYPKGQHIEEINLLLKEKEEFEKKQEEAYKQARNCKMEGGFIFFYIILLFLFHNFVSTTQVRKHLTNK